MYIHAQTSPIDTPIPGLAHSTWAGHAEGLSQLSMWRQSIAPGGATPPHRHDCDEIVLCSAGAGELHIAGEVHRFQAGSTVTLPLGDWLTVARSGATVLAPAPGSLSSGDAVGQPGRALQLRVSLAP